MDKTSPDIEYKIEYDSAIDDYELVEILSKAIDLKKAEKSKVPIREAYLKDLYNYSNDIYERVMNQMAKEILEVLTDN